MQDEMASALASQLGQTTTKLLEKNLNIKPTLEIRPGYQFNIIVTKDMEQKQEQRQELAEGREEEVAAARAPLAGQNSDQETVREPADQKVFLAVPYREKERAKAAGARWNPEAKLWYAPVGADMKTLYEQVKIADKIINY